MLRDEAESVEPGVGREYHCPMVGKSVPSIVQSLEPITEDIVIQTFTISELAAKLSGMISGDALLTISGIEQIEQAGPGQLTFVGGKKYIPLWEVSKASAALVNQDLAVEPGPGRAVIRVRNADLAMAEVLGLFEPPAPIAVIGVHPNASVDPSAELGDGVSIGAGCYVGPGVKIGAGTILYPNVTVLDGTVIGASCILWSGVVVRDRCRIGNGTILQIGVSIGGDGFGYRPSADGRSLVKIPHIGTVEIGNGVEIGANSTVDRGKFSATVIGDGTKIDNLVQIGHNCRIGRCCVIAACTGVAGSVTMGDGVQVGGCAAIKDHVTIGSGARIGGGSGVIADVAPKQIVLGYPADDYKSAMRQWASIKKLPELLHTRQQADSASTAD
jgi:UDP-3-O-[3-hydroxymyristoyl] glucosamine N-acyltransferase